VVDQGLQLRGMQGLGHLRLLDWNSPPLRYWDGSMNSNFAAGSAPVGLAWTGPGFRCQIRPGSGRRPGLVVALARPRRESRNRATDAAGPKI